MAKPIIGGEGSIIQILYHYSKDDITPPIRKASYWTTLKTDSPEEAAAVTKTSATGLRYRSMVRVNEETEVATSGDLSKWFREAGLQGGHPEFQSQKPVTAEYIEETVKINDPK